MSRLEKMKERANKGFALSTFIYIIYVLFIAVLPVVLVIIIYYGLFTLVNEPELIGGFFGKIVNGFNSSK